jgi:8-hydroxy-5-deazaflavin:NADPH oxidoreductase
MDSAATTPAPSTIAFIGGTGPQGRGLGMRLAQAGHRVLLGSRTAEKAEDAVAKVGEKVADLPIEGRTNADACAEADVVVVVVPYAAQQATLADLAGAIGDKVVVNCVNSLGFDAAGPHAVPVEAGSAAEECQELLPEARVVGAWQNVSAVKLNRPDEPVDVDVLLTGDDEEAREVVAALVEVIPGMRPVHAGPLRLSRPIEELTAVLIAVNKRYGTHAGVKVAGLD